ncbi:MAG: hypothetical protein IKN45_10270, partial [Lachnospiraceae bacterium]|nr:hypothetical protein [Lachnospiraceae bacterium]
QDMNAYDFPNALSKFQMQDMSKIGAVLDLTRGVKKILGTTHSQVRDARIDAIVASQQEQVRQNKALKSFIIIAGTCVILAITVVGIILLNKNKKTEIQNRERQIAISENYIEEQASVVFENESAFEEIDSEDEPRITEVTTGFPDPLEYDEFSVKITNENIDEYFEEVEVEGTKYFFPKGAEQGWFGYPYLDYEASNGGGGNQNYLPSDVTNVNGKIKYYSLNSLEKWSCEGKNSFQAVFLTFTLAPFDANRDVITHYTGVLSKYAPEKEVDSSF